MLICQNNISFQRKHYKDTHHQNLHIIGLLQQKVVLKNNAHIMSHTFKAVILLPYLELAKRQSQYLC